ncbi:efflux RND transporter periplasmic adaptor subunit [Tenacibaculum sp. MEBiC06402]|uniref:efflux RND transporter periplasmic adaptor subunit n=1 Tax=Tenacibaculum sp. MEBiC07804 TaxID=3412025 RepID=UPI003B98FE1B
MKLYPLFFLVIYILLSCESKQDKTLPVKRELVECVYSSVTIQPDSVYNVHSTVSGIIENVLVKEGTQVARNQDIIQIINNTPKLNLKNSELSLQLAHENYFGKATILNTIKDEIASAYLNYKNDSINFFRQKNLWQQKIGSNAEYDARKLKYELSKNNLYLLKNKYTQTENQLKTALKQAENSYRVSQINTKDFTVKSKIKGKVYAIYKEPGELISIQEPLALIGSSNRFLIEMLVDEVDIVRIRENMDVIIKLDAYKEQTFSAKVSKIYPQKDERNQTFKVEATFINAPEVLYAGLSGEANIIIKKKENVLTIPKSYLTEGNQVLTKNGLVTVKLGLENIEFIEVISGIDENTYIYKE